MRTLRVDDPFNVQGGFSVMQFFLNALLLLILTLFLPSLGSAQSARGLDNPTVSFNLGTTHDYSPVLQFIDL